MYFAELIRRLDIEAEVAAKAVIVPSGFTAERAVSGEVELAVQQISELMVVPGIEVVGPLPFELQTVATFSADVLTAYKQPEAAVALLRFLSSSQATPILRSAGLDVETMKVVHPG